MEDDRFLRLEEFAQRLAYSYHRTRELIIGKGVIPYTRIGARGIRGKKRDLDAFIANMDHDKPEKERIRQKPVDSREAIEEVTEEKA